LEQPYSYRANLSVTCRNRGQMSRQKHGHGKKTITPGVNELERRQAIYNK